MSELHKAPPVSGYRDLSQEVVDLMNQIKEKEEEVRELFLEVREKAFDDDNNAALRHADIARTALESGFMWLVKAVARPDKGLGQNG